jgi:hypothetical protein
MEKGFPLKFATLLAAVFAAAGLTTAAATGTVGMPGGLPVLELLMNGSSIHVVRGARVSGGVNVHSRATSEVSGTPIFVRLNPGVSADQVVTFFNSKKAANLNNIKPYGSIVFDAVVGRGKHDVQTKLQPGDYVAFDGARDNPAQWPHTTFSISEYDSPASLPAVQQWQKSVEFRFRGPRTFHTGELVRASNVGRLVHMMEAFRVTNETAGRQAVRLFRAGKDSKARNLFGERHFSLFGPVSHGAVQQLILKARPGWYVEVCSMETRNGRKHTQLGMARLIHIIG